MKTFIATIVTLPILNKERRHKVRRAIKHGRWIPRWILLRKDILDEHEISIFGMPVLQWGSRILFDGTREKFVRIFHKSLEHQFLDWFLSFIPKEHDLIFLIRGGGSGDIRLVSYFMGELAAQRGAKNPAIACWSQKAVEVLSYILGDDIPIYNNFGIEGKFWSEALQKREYKYKGRKFLVIHMPRSDGVAFYKNAYDLRITQPQYYLDYWKCKKYEYRTPVVSMKDSQSAENKMKILGLEEKKFVFILPEANVFLSMEKSFWKKIVSDMQNAGFMVFENAANGAAQYGGESIICSIPEACFIAEKSAAIVGIRCGFVELISHLEVPKHIIYTHVSPNILESENLSTKDLMNIATLRAFPGIETKDLFEYNTELESGHQIANKIIAEVTHSKKWKK
jgi:hypothetical protein